MTVMGLMSSVFLPSIRQLSETALCLMMVFFDVINGFIKEVDEAIYHVKKAIIRHKAVSDNCRIDGRKTDDIRPITVIPSFLPKTHGSALFIRGETQALVTTTLSAQDSSAQLLDDITSSIKQYDNFMLHYNMPGYSVGECGFPMSPKRRDWSW